MRSRYQTYTTAREAAAAAKVCGYVARVLGCCDVVCIANGMEWNAAGLIPARP
jgi:hypothetical protein